jgi:dTDP-4-dehydrorhamnose 3,5-epimerase
MAIQVQETNIPGVRICVPDVYPDARGFFMETYQQERYDAAGIPGPFVQDNYSHSARGVVRGMHYQLEKAQAKLVFVPHGEIFDVVVDVRRGSPAFGQWQGYHLSSENRKQLYVPVGLAHGFCVLSETVDVMYKCSNVYYPEGERGLLWNDPGIGIEWPVDDPIISGRDTKHPCLAEIDPDSLPVFNI